MLSEWIDSECNIAKIGLPLLGNSKLDGSYLNRSKFHLNRKGLNELLTILRMMWPHYEVELPPMVFAKTFHDKTNLLV